MRASQGQTSRYPVPPLVARKHLHSLPTNCPQQPAQVVAGRARQRKQQRISQRSDAPTSADMLIPLQASDLRLDRPAAPEPSPLVPGHRAQSPQYALPARALDPLKADGPCRALTLPIPPFSLAPYHDYRRIPQHNFPLSPSIPKAPPIRPPPILPSHTKSRPNHLAPRISNPRLLSSFQPGPQNPIVRSTHCPHTLHAPSIH